MKSQANTIYRLLPFGKKKIINESVIKDKIKTSKFLNLLEYTFSSQNNKRDKEI